MKKILLVALAAAAMVGCSQNEEIDNVAQKAEIKIGTAVSTITRAAVTDNANFKAFTVSAYTVAEADITTADKGLGAAYMDKVDYTGGKASWTPVISKTYYWPLNEEMHFFAYPTVAKENFVAPTTGYPTLSFTVADKAADQTDLVVAHAKVTEKPANGQLSLKFKHILARINFSYKPADASYIYTIESINIKDITGGAALYTFDADNGTWNTGSGSAKTYQYTINVAAEATDDFYALGSADASLMLLPQSVAGKQIEVTYKTEKDGHTFFNSTKVVTLPADATWGMGQNIRYKLTLPVGAEDIKLDTDVDSPAETEPATPVVP